jgi:hypothetical protein
VARDNRSREDVEPAALCDRGRAHVI